MEEIDCCTICGAHPAPAYNVLIRQCCYPCLSEYTELAHRLRSGDDAKRILTEANKGTREVSILGRVIEVGE